MKNYTIRLSTEAEEDIDNLYDYIANELMLPFTADKYVGGIFETIEKLSVYGGSIPINQRQYLQVNYGPGARTVTYKKMTIVFNVIRNAIFIRRIMPGSMVL
ncbi:MAG: type II toxin-antitoxin system RelE/ParE family toxin [Candidatus Symbiothrix sp.]|jgi:plasmid stabilization system protein ParE|nr:type II toxin-antitoxin system RelE/ParE family toxin [Candidatus Symbiothrix sp.]